MNLGLLFPFLAAALLALPGFARADRNPNFENDALPILKHQPGLVDYVHAHYVVKETGVAQSPGTAEEAPQPPYIFSAKPRGASGPFYLRLLIQPGPVGHILKVADIRKLPGGGVPPQETAPAEASAPAPQETAPSVPPASDQAPATPAASLAPPPDNAPQPATAPASTNSPTANTPSGPIID
jgi:hypothetical protein